MKKLNLFILTFIFIFASTLLLAQEQEEQQGQIPPGMEVIQDGRIKVIIPQDAKRRQEGNLTVVETTDAYASRKFMGMEERLVGIEAKQETLRTELETLRKNLEEIQEKLNRFSFEH